MKVDGNKESMLRQIEAIRERMTILGTEYGLCDPEVIAVSRELDAWIVQYHKLKCDDGPQPA